MQINNKKQLIILILLMSCLILIPIIIALVVRFTTYNKVYSTSTTGIFSILYLIIFFIRLNMQVKENYKNQIKTDNELKDEIEEKGQSPVKIRISQFILSISGLLLLIASVLFALI